MAAKKATSSTGTRSRRTGQHSTGQRRARTSVEKRKAKASKARKDLVSKLKRDLQASKKAIRTTTKAANTELKLARAAAKAEIDVLKEQLALALKREEALRKLSQQKAKMMWQAGEQWEKQQLAKLKQSLKRTSRSRG
ncbi:MAG: hypothetical protein P8Z67_12160 [Gammaproteobacteria bacterium]